MKTKILEGYYRHDIVKLHPLSSLVGVELGIAEADLSYHLYYYSGKFKTYIGIDAYSDRGHDVEQYKRALRRMGLYSGYKLFRMSFNDALDLFENNSLDFLYVDGYAHEAEINTLELWYPKVKQGGLFCGDDYDVHAWPRVFHSVNAFCVKYSYEELFVTDKNKIGNTAFSKYPTWGAIKK